MKAFIAAMVALVLSGCAAQPARIATTASGWPEVEIFTSNKQAVKENIIQRNAATGWNLEQESDSSLLFTKVDDSGSFNSAMTQALIGNSYSTPPKYEARYIISSYAGKVKIVVNVSVSTQMAFGQVNRVFLNKNNATFNAFQGQLYKVKSEVEGVASRSN